MSRKDEETDYVYISDIVTNPDGRFRKTLNQAAVAELAKSIEDIGQQVPIVVRRIKGNKFELVAGAHRIAAMQSLEDDSIKARILNRCSPERAKLLEVSENLHRAELTALERAEHVASWVKLLEAEAEVEKAKDAAARAKVAKELAKAEAAKPAQVAPVSKGGRGKESGINAAARELKIERTAAQRAVKVASLSDAAKETARASGLDDNQSALLKAASRPTEAEQVAALQERVEPPKPSPPPAVAVKEPSSDASDYDVEWLKRGTAARKALLAQIAEKFDHHDALRLKAMKTSDGARYALTAMGIFSEAVGLMVDMAATGWDSHSARVILHDMIERATAEQDRIDESESTQKRATKAA